MKTLKWAVSLTLIIIFALCSVFITGNAGSKYQLGDKIDDFTVTTYDGRTVNLYDLLAENEMVLINIWATWCGPCRMEFPYMQEAYLQYSDQIEIVALSCEPTDTDEVLAQFVADIGMTFPVGRDTVGLSSDFSVTGIPTSIIVDRNGIICFVISGALTETGMFCRLFDVYTNDSYSEPVLLTSIPEAMPDIEPASEDELASALTGSGGIAFRNDPGSYVWPMVITDIDGRSAAASTNAGVESSASKIYADFSASSGDAAVITFKTSTQPVFDRLVISLNGEPVKAFGGVHDWTTYAVPIESDGEYELCVSYERAGATSGNEDTIWIDSIELLSGDAAAEAIGSNPVYPTGAGASIAAVNEGARRITIDDPSGVLLEHFGECDYYIVNSTFPEIRITLAPGMDPENMIAFSNYDGSTWPLADHMTDDGYTITCRADSIATTGYAYTTLYVFDISDPNAAPMCITYFADEFNINEFTAGVYGSADGWSYADDAEPSADAELPEADGPSAYTLAFVDQNGAPVQGVIAQVCDDSICMVYTSDENGMCTFELEPYAYEVHILKLPDGYSGDTETIVHTPAEGGTLTFTLTKN